MRSPDRPGAVSVDARRDGVVARRAAVLLGLDEARAVAFLAVAFLAVAFFAVALFAVAFFAVGFLAVAFFAVGFLAAAFFAAAFLAAAFLAEAFLAAAFFAVGFFAVAFFAGMVRSPLRGRPPRLGDYILQGRFGQEVVQRHARALRARR